MNGDIGKVAALIKHASVVWPIFAFSALYWIFDSIVTACQKLINEKGYKTEG